MRYGILGLVWVSVAAAVIGFYQPWARIDLREPALLQQLRQAAPLGDAVGGLTRNVRRITAKIRRGAETITGDLPSLADIPKQVSGADIPALANANHSQVAIALAELFTRKRQQIGLQSYAVYLAPGLALLAGLLLTFVPGMPAAVGTALACAVVSGVGFWKLLTTNTSALFAAITIGPGLWLSLWAYAALALCGVLLALIRPRRN